MRGPLRSAGLLVVLLLLAALGLAGPAAAQAERAPLFGPELDWGVDSARAYADRLGREPSLYAKPAVYPLTEDEGRFVDEFVVQVSRERALAVLDLRPTVALDRLTRADADALADRLAASTEGGDVDLLLRFAPDMNTPYEPWGLQPSSYVQAFRTVADAVHARAPRVETVWSPAAGDAAAFGVPPRPVPPGTDTDGDGALTAADDPYAPYWPGEAAVDRVGTSSYGTTGGVPPEGEVLRQVRPFAQRYGTGRPLLLQTGAFAPEGAGAQERARVQGAWADQALSPGVLGLPGLDGVVWLELQRAEPRASGRDVDWRATSTRASAAALRARLGGTEPGKGVVPFEPRGPRAAEQEGTVLRGASAYVAVGALVAGVALLLLLSATGRAAGWRYRQVGERDLRVDLLRGLAVCFVVLNHLGLTSAWHLLTQEALGPVSGAELFVLLSGVVLGQVHRRRTLTGGVRASVPHLLARAWTLYLTALAVAALCLAARLLPGVSGTAVTTYTDAATGEVYDLYAGVDGLLSTTPPFFLVRDVLLLRMGPWQFNVMGLYVVLLLLTPLALLLLRRRLAVALAGLSVALYVLQAVRPVRLLPSQFEDAFPLLAWQLLFVLGLLGGWYREELLAFAGRRRGRAVVALCVLLAVAAAVFSWCSPYLSNALDVRLALLDDATFRRVYDAFFVRTTLDVGRLLSVLVLAVALLALLTAFWEPVARTAGRVLVPLGQASLYVFVLQVVLALVLGEVAALDDAGLLVGTAVHTAALALLWVAVRRRFLFGVLPR